MNGKNNTQARRVLRKQIRDYLRDTDRLDCFHISAARFPRQPSTYNFSLVLFTVVVVAAAAPAESISSSFSAAVRVCLFTTPSAAVCACVRAPFPAISSGSVNIFVRRRSRPPRGLRWRVEGDGVGG